MEKNKTLTGIKDRITELRKRQNISREELAEKIGVHINVIGRYERGETKPSLKIAIKLAATLSVSIDFLVGVINEEVNTDLLNQILVVQSLPEEEQRHIKFTLSALIRDAKSRENYSE